MSETNLAVREAAATPDPMAQWELMMKQAAILRKSGFLPAAIKTDAQAVAIIQAGRELGLGVMEALRSINVIQGKPTLSAELMAALALKRVPGARLRCEVAVR
jgi:hypothetical protein